MSFIGNETVQLGATAGAFAKDMKAAGNSVDAFQKQVRAIPEIGEKMTAGFGRIQQVSGAFETMASNATMMEKAVAGVSTGIGALTVGLQLATKVATGMKAALLGTGIGVLIVGLGELLSMTKKAGARDAEAPSPAMDFARRHARPVEDRGGTPLSLSWGVDLAPTRTPGRGSTPEGIREIATAIGDIGPRTEDMARGLEHAGESTEAFVGRARAHRDHLMRTASATVHASDAFRSFSASVDIAARRLAVLATRRDMEKMAADGRAMEMSVRTPLEAANKELDRMSILLERGSISFGTFNRAVGRLLGDAPVGLEASRARLSMIVTTYERTARELADTRERIERSFIGRGMALLGLRLPELDRAPFIRSLEAIAGDTRGPLARLTDRLTELREARDALRRVVTVDLPGGTRGIRPADMARLGRFDTAAARELLSAAGERQEIQAPQALMQNSIEAVAEVQRLMRQSVADDPVARVAAGVERLRHVAERTEATERAILRALEDGRLVLPGV